MNTDIEQKKNNSLFDRVVDILEEARSNVVRAVNSNMVLACWLIGREIVQELQGGEERAEYGKQVVEDLSKSLIERYGSGFSIANIKNFRQFYQAYPQRLDPISYPLGSQLPERQKSYPAGSQSISNSILLPPERELTKGFSSQLSWSHYRALMRVKKEKSRLFYEQYSVLNERKQIFASKYMLYLPSEEALKLEIEKERRLIEEYLEEKDE